MLHGANFDIQLMTLAWGPTRGVAAALRFSLSLSLRQEKHFLHDLHCTSVAQVAQFVHEASPFAIINYDFAFANCSYAPFAQFVVRVLYKIMRSGNLMTSFPHATKAL